MGNNSYKYKVNQMNEQIKYQLEQQYLKLNHVKQGNLRIFLINNLNNLFKASTFYYLLVALKLQFDVLKSYIPSDLKNQLSIIGVNSSIISQKETTQSFSNQQTSSAILLNLNWMITGKKIQTIINIRQSKPQSTKIITHKQQKQIKLPTTINKIPYLQQSEQLQHQINHHLALQAPIPFKNHQSINQNSKIIPHSQTQPKQTKLASNPYIKQQSSVLKQQKFINPKSTIQKTKKLAAQKAKNNLKQKSIKIKQTKLSTQSLNKNAKKQKVSRQVDQQIQKLVIFPSKDVSNQTKVTDLVQNQEPQDSIHEMGIQQKEQQKKDQDLSGYFQKSSSPCIVKNGNDQPFFNMFLNSDVFLKSTQQLLKQEYIKIDVKS